MAIDKGENCCQVLSQGALLLLQPLRGLINALLWIGLSFRPLAEGTSHTSFYILKKKIIFYRNILCYERFSELE